MESMGPGESAQRATIEFRCLGLFAFRAPDGPWQKAPSRAGGGQFLRYLANHTAASVACESLADALWPELDAAQSAHRLHIAASGARTALRPLAPNVNPIVYSHSTYGWNPRLQILRDIDVLERYFEDGSTSAYLKGAQVYAGAFLSGDNADWVVPLRVRFEHMYATMLESLATTALEAHDYARANSFALELVAVDRANERATQLAMLSFARTGRRAQALAEYDDLERYLRKWLNVSPTSETTSLRTRIVEGGPY
ncbi:MAG: bacterial transcriptional activator domain-containing protein [Candidatus Cybelea sp.]